LSLKCQTIKLNPRQYAREGHSTSDAFIYLHQAIHGAADRGDCGAKIFLADISKGFDMIDHIIVLTELIYWYRSCTNELDQGVSYQQIASG